MIGVFNEVVLYEYRESEIVSAIRMYGCKNCRFLICEHEVPRSDLIFTHNGDIHGSFQ